MLISIAAIYNYDNTIFDDLNLPEGMDKETLVNMIIFELGELSVLYSRPSFLKLYISKWSNSRINVWNHLWALENEEYDPLDNYNRTDTTTTDHGHKLVIDRAKSGSSQDAGSNSNTDSKKDYVYGYNSSTKAPSSETDLTHTGSFTQTGSNSESGQDVHTNSGRDIETKHGKGNIGVTTYGKMISEELELRPKLNMYKYIVTEFKCQFCVLVY